jgi:hypothetical protein
MSSFGKRGPKGFGGIEKRRAPRTPVANKAWIVLEDRSAHPCLIRDISSGGARLEVPSILGLPNRFILREGSVQRQVSVVRKGVRHLAVKFCRE